MQVFGHFWPKIAESGHFGQKWSKWPFLTKNHKFFDLVLSNFGVVFGQKRQNVVLLPVARTNCVRPAKDKMRGASTLFEKVVKKKKEALFSVTLGGRDVKWRDLLQRPRKNCIQYANLAQFWQIHVQRRAPSRC